MCIGVYHTDELDHFIVACSKYMHCLRAQQRINDNTTERTNGNKCTNLWNRNRKNQINRNIQSKRARFISISLHLWLWNRFGLTCASDNNCREIPSSSWMIKLKLKIKKTEPHRTRITNKSKKKKSQILTSWFIKALAAKKSRARFGSKFIELMANMKTY